MLYIGIGESFIRDQIPVRGAATCREGAGVTGAFAVWRRAIAPVYDVTLPRRTAFRLDDTSWQLPRGFLYAGRGSAIELTRDAALIARHPLDRISLFRIVKGKVVATYDDREATLRVGDMVVLDYALPSHSRSTAFSCQAATVPRDRAPVRGRYGDLHGIVLPGGSPLGVLLGRQFDALIAGFGALDAAPAEAAFSAFVDYAVRFWPAPDGTHAEADPLDRAMAIIHDELGDPGLTPSAIAKRLKISRASLYEAFADQGGISATIWSLRLDEALKMLVRERRHSGLVQDVATRYAYKSIAHFSRAFTARFGRNPSEVIALSHKRVGGKTFGEWLTAGARDATADSIQAWLDGGAR